MYYSLLMAFYFYFYFTRTISLHRNVVLVPLNPQSIQPDMKRDREVIPCPNNNISILIFRITLIIMNA